MKKNNTVQKNKPGPGRPKGVPNKISGGVRSNVVAVFDRIGGREAMAEWAMENKTEFYKLYAKLLPKPVELTGEDWGDLKVRFVIEK